MGRIVEPHLHGLVVLVDGVADHRHADRELALAGREGQRARGQRLVVVAGGGRAAAGVRVLHRRRHLAHRSALRHREQQLRGGARGALVDAGPADRQRRRAVVVLDGARTGTQVRSDRAVRRIAELDRDRLVLLVDVVAGHRHADRPLHLAGREGQRACGQRLVVVAGGRRAGARVRVLHRRRHLAHRSALGHREQQFRGRVRGALQDAAPADRQHRGRVVVADGAHSRTQVRGDRAVRRIVEFDLDGLVLLVDVISPHRYGDRPFPCAGRESQRPWRHRIVVFAGSRHSLAGIGGIGIVHRRHHVLADRPGHFHREQQFRSGAIGSLVDARPADRQRRSRVVVLDDAGRRFRHPHCVRLVSQPDDDGFVLLVVAISQHLYGNLPLRITGREGQCVRGQRLVVGAGDGRTADEILVVHRRLDLGGSALRHREQQLRGGALGSLHDACLADRQLRSRVVVLDDAIRRTLVRRHPRADGAVAQQLEADGFVLLVVAISQHRYGDRPLRITGREGQRTRRHRVVFAGSRHSLAGIGGIGVVHRRLDLRESDLLHRETAARWWRRRRPRGRSHP